jgi:DNA mismatch endonuclease (patch repair protein)
LLGTPDIAIQKCKIVIFVDSCFWHGCELHYRAPETNREYWQKKIDKNRARDLKTTEYYVNHNWHVLRVWEHELNQDFEETIKKIVDFINQYRKTLKSKVLT